MKKPAIPKPTQVSKPDILSFDEIYQWLRLQEGPPSLTAVKDGKTKSGQQLYSIGLGHQIQPNEAYLLSSTITNEEVARLFENDIESIRLNLNKVIKVPVNKNQQLALLSLRYNIGADAFNNSTLLRKLNTGDYNAASTHFAEWRLSEGKIVQGLVNRRERERQLFVTKIDKQLPVTKNESNSQEKYPDTPENRKKKEELQKQLKEAEEIIERLKKNYGQPIPSKTFSS
jgi:GH24 family phage-related lysozyme (muramidase)